MIRFLVVLLPAVAGCAALRVPAPLAPPRAAEAPAPPLEAAWRLDAGGAFGREPTLVTSAGAFVTTRRGDVILVDGDGRRRGRVSVGSAVEGAPALVAGRTLVVPVDGGRYGLVALDLLSGSRAWRALRGVAVHAGVVVASGVAVAPALDGTVYGVDFESGEVRWRSAATAGASHRAPPIELPDGTVLVSNTLGRLDALDPATGAVAWSAEAGAPVEEAPALGGGLLLVPTTRGRLLALDPATGAVRWRHEASSAGARFYTPAAAAGALFAAHSGGELLRLGYDGAVQWRHETDGHVAAAPLVAAGLLYAGTLDRRLLVLDAGTGAERWSHEFSGRVKSAPVALGGLVLVPAEPGVVWAFRAAAQAATTP